MYAHKDGITLRKIERSDLKSLLGLKSESWWGTHKSLVVNMDDQEAWYNSIPKDQLYMIGEWVDEQGFNVPVGVVVFTDIDWISRTLRISGSIYKEYRKQEIVLAGFSAGLDFAFEMLNMRRVEAEVLEYNVPAQQLEINFLGFKIEGRRRKAVYKCGGYYDSIMLGMMREEWQSHPRVIAYGDSCNRNFSPNKMQKLIERFNQSKAEVLASLSLHLENTKPDQS
jgi:RimJ/RimL family protein N-acetyltransferase